MRNGNRFVASGLAILTTMVSADIWAQEAAPAASKEPADAGTMDAVVVTAQKRSEDALEVPISIDVMRNKDLERRHLETTEDVVSYSPNAQMGRGNSGAAYTPYIAIRGIGSAEIDSDPSVGMFVDGIPVTDTQSYVSNLLDMSRIEILRGPQGTLYGRNTLGGSINLITNRPDPHVQEAKVLMDVGNHGYVRSEIIGNAPLKQGESAIRAALAFDRNSGTVNNYAPGQKNDQAHENYQGRISYLQDLSYATTLELSLEGQKQRRRDGAVKTLADYDRGIDGVDLKDPFAGELKSMGARAEITHSLNDGHILTSLTGFRDQDTNYAGRAAPDGYFASTEAYLQAMGLTGYQRRTNNSFSGDFQQFSQEFRLSSPDTGKLKYVLGLYGDFSKRDRTYGAQDSWDTANFIFPGTTGANVDMTGNTDSWSIAAFGDGSYAFTEHWEAFAGVRIGHDAKDFDYRLKTDNDAYVQMMLASPQGESVVTSYSKRLSHTYVTPRGGIRYRFNDDHNVYASVSRGYKSGGFNTSILYPSIPVEYKEETLTNYEIGLKSAFLNRRVTVEGALFYIDWNNQQVLSYDTLTNATPILNADKSRSYGAELTLNAQLGEGWYANLGLGYADATYRDFKNAPRTGQSGTVDVSGNQQQYHSKFTGNIEIGYEWEMGIDALRGMANVGYQYRSKFYFDPENTISQDGYGTLSARIGASNNTYGIFLWGRNLTNERALASAAHLNGDGILVTQITPRTFGITGFIKF